VFLDPRGDERALRVSWHAEAGVVVLSLWRDNVCAGSFRLAASDVPEMIEVLREALDASYRHAPTRAGLPTGAPAVPTQRSRPETA